ncbi:hypothetical protein [Marinagarivorans cellulosilyticus]|uniref:PilZ domain-containing protein n=1 Tax=Marinagarivorans cellulosilyticus TaxID=2721545 RepID=A0AAN1WH52_9GAMM|nr:hypothetical protein [Marinagarivorans cellulosilyticus]BCD97507.1 hypothetical protein MARGE09_P1708 [Marinagarivorans cellulosilyticus]
MVVLKSPKGSVDESTETLQAWMAYSCRWVDDVEAEVCNFQGFIKHPSDIPLDFSIEPSPSYATAQMLNVHDGGMVFETRRSLPIGAKIHLTVNLRGTALNLHGVITHCISVGESRCDVGVQFEEDNEHYAMRMIEQACHIEHYRQLLSETSGRELTEDEAAAEWIARFAAYFPR